jgi:hypothetical protein
MSLSARVSVPRAVLRSSSTSIGPYKSSESAILRCSHTEGWKIGRDGAQFTWNATGPDLYLLWRIYSILGIRPRHTGLPGQAFCTACWGHCSESFPMSDSLVEGVSTRLLTDKRHSPRHEPGLEMAGPTVRRDLDHSAGSGPHPHSVPSQGNIRG